MKLRLSLVCLSLVPALLNAGPVDSRIIAATVYQDRAVVSREAHVETRAGQQTFVFENLPEQLSDDSLQVSLRGTVEATILDVNAATAFVASEPDTRAKALLDQIKEIARQDRTLDNRVGVLGEERSFVKAMLVAETAPTGADPSHITVAGPRPNLDDWQKLFTYSEDTLSKIAAELQSIDEQKSALSDKKVSLEGQLAELNGNNGKSVKNVSVRLNAAAAGTLDVVLKYSVPGARWSPSYDARLKPSERAVDLSYFGMVRNATGEDWDRIELTLSTARPNLGGGAPELQPWIVDVAQPRRLYGALRAMPNAASPALMAREEEKTLAGTDLEPFTVTTDVEMNATSATFKVREPVSIASDNSLQKVSISTARLNADLRYEATPKLMEAAFLTATAYNTSDYPFLAGKMNTFLDDTFVAASRLKTVMPGQKFELQLGVDDAIAVSRRLVNRFSENTGLTNNGKRVTYDILITITNNRKSPEKVLFKEPLPLSRNEKIVVKVLTPDEGDIGTKESPKEVILDDSKLEWSLELKAGEKREVPIKFSVDYPGNVSVEGLE